MEWKCKFCGSTNTETVGGPNGDPFDRRPEQVICLDCGSVLFSEEEALACLNEALQTQEEAEPQFILRVEFHAEACGISSDYLLELPKEDGVYDLSKNNHPALAHFHTLKIEGQQIRLNEEAFLITRSPFKIVKSYTAYGPDRIGYPETVEITFTEERK